MNEEHIWYLYQDATQMGPFDAEQLLEVHHNNMIAQDSYVFKVGWKDWRPVEEGLEELGIKMNDQTVNDNELAQRRVNAPRASISGRVVVHNNGQLSIGTGVNISPTGIFVETKDKIFQIGELLKISVRADGLSRSFNVVAKVIRFNADGRFPLGYGLRFENLEESIKEEIVHLVDQAQLHRGA